MLKEEQKGAVHRILEPLKEEVGMILFVSDECQFCDVEEELMEELASLGKVSTEVLDVDSEEAEDYGIKGAPTLLFRDRPGIRYMGMPSGHEFRYFLDTILMVGNGESGLEKGTKEKLAGLESPVELMVFVTPNCPHCPAASMAANRLAMESDKVTGITVEAREFMELSRKHGVMSVPKTVVNGKNGFVGAMPDSMFLEKVLEAL